MFTNLIESQSHGREFKRRGRFLLATAAAYAFLFFAAGIATIYAYDARLEAQTTELMLDVWVPPVKPIADRAPARTVQPSRHSAQSNVPIDPHITTPIRTAGVSTTDNPLLAPEKIGVTGGGPPPVQGTFVIGDGNVNPPGLGDTGCITCKPGGTGTAIPIDDTPPPVPEVVKPPQTQRLASTVLVSKAMSLPQPPYPPLARQIKISGPVNVQILVDESGRVISAHAVSGHAFLTRSAEDAAHRARFTPTILNGQPVKVQGVITYNFVLQ